MLWVTDDPDVIEPIIDSLKRKGHEVVIASDTNEAYMLKIPQMQLQGGIDLIIVEEVLAPGTLDPKSMIGRDSDYTRGAAFIRRLNVDGFTIPVIAIESALSGSLDEVAEEDLGFPIEIIHTPITTHRFSKVLEQIANRPT